MSNEVEETNEIKPDKDAIFSELESMTFGGAIKNKKADSEKKKEKKKEKKEKKKGKKKNSLALDLTPFMDADNPDGGFDINLDHLVDEVFDEDGNPIIDPIIDAEKKGYNKRKNDKNAYKKEFAEEMTLLYDLYDNVSSFAKEIEKGLKATTGSKVRGSTKNHADMVANYLSAKTTQLQVIKELNSTKKTIADLNLKENAQNKKENNGDSNTSLMASNYLQQVMNAGRNNFLQSVRGTTKPGFLIDAYASDVGDDDDDPTTLLDYSGTTPGYSSAEDFQMNQFLLERVSEEDGFDNLRTADGSKLIQYESRGAEVCIKKDISTGEYEFIALDRDNQILYDYPLPRNPGKIKFAGLQATDRHGRTYRVIEYDGDAFTEEEDEY